MRLRRLDLVRYGKFTDFTINFGEASPGNPDLHVIYGPNEAGKSTTLSAWLDLLFGIPMQSGYGFLHPYNTMRIGALIEGVDGAANGVAREFNRIKRPAHSLQDGQGQPLPESALRGALGNLTRETYCQMFSLDDVTLEKGGEEILASKGDLGQLLFAASAGLDGLSARLKQTHDEAEKIYRKGGSKNLIADYKRQLNELAERRKSLDTIAAAYQELKRQAQEAAAAYADADAQRRAIAAAAARNGRRLNAWPRFRALRRAQADLVELGHLPADGLALIDRHAALAAAGADIDTRRRALVEEVAGLDAEIGEAPTDGAVLALATRIEGLSGWRARHETAQVDLPKRRLAAQEIETRLASILAGIGQGRNSAPEGLLIAAPDAARIRQLLDRRSGVEAALEAARTEAVDAKRTCLEAEAQLAELGASPAPSPEAKALINGLASSLANLRGADPGARLGFAAKAHDRARGQLDERLTTLKPWQGSADEMASLSLPSLEQVRAQRAKIDARGAEIDRLRGQRDAALDDLTRCEAEQVAIAGPGGPATEQDAKTVREARDAAWARHRASLDPDSADLFEARLRDDDDVTAALVAQGADRGRMQELAKAKALAHAQARQAAERLEEATLAEAALRAELKDRLPGELAGLPLLEIESWLQRHAAASAAMAAVYDAAQDLREAQADADAHRAALLRLLEGIGVTAAAHEAADVLMARLEGAAQQEAKAEALRLAAGEARRLLKRRTDDLSEAVRHEASWVAEFAGACARTWLKGEDGAPDVATVRSILPMLGELASVLDRRNENAHRIAAMEADQAEFGARVAELAHDMGFGSLESEPPLETASRIAARLRRAQDERARQEGLRGRREAASAKLGALEAEAGRHRAEQDRHLSVLGATDLESAARIVADLRRREELLQDVKRAESDILEMLDLEDLSTAEAFFSVGRPEEWRQNSEDAERQREVQERLCEDLLLKRDAAQRALDAVGADAKAAEIEQERRTLRLEIEDAAARYLRLRAGLLAAEQALRLYRERHRSAMMRRASEAFRLVSRGAYRELATQPDPKGERLIAIGAEGSSKEASEMSKGTRFQLYLALRVAGYEEFAQVRPPVPFIADDIMETFDEMRAEEAFKVLGEMSLKGQVIYLTHHRHLCTIAREVVPTVALHEL